MNKQHFLTIPHSDSASGSSQGSYESGLGSGSMCPLFKPARQCMVPVHGLNSLDTCFQTSNYLKMILEALQMPNLKVELLENFTFISSQFEERCWVWVKFFWVLTKQGNSLPRARGGGGVPSGNNHRAANQNSPLAIITASQHNFLSLRLRYRFLIRFRPSAEYQSYCTTIKIL